MFKATADMEEKRAAGGRMVVSPKLQSHESLRQKACEGKGSI